MIHHGKVTYFLGGLGHLLGQKKHTTERKEVRVEKPAGLELTNRFDWLEVEGKDEHKQEMAESSNFETVMIGSSMVGGVGKALEAKLEGKFAWMKYSGARIEDTSKLQEVELGPDVENFVFSPGMERKASIILFTWHIMEGEFIHLA